MENRKIEEDSSRFPGGDFRHLRFALRFRWVRCQWSNVPERFKAEQRAQKKPDLTLTSDDIVFSPPSPTEGETVTITATIHNIGTTFARNL